MIRNENLVLLSLLSASLDSRVVPVHPRVEYFEVDQIFTQRFVRRIGKRYKAAQLIESILSPGAVIAQGFRSYQFTMNSGKSHVGFVVSEGANQTSIRSVTGVATVLNKAEIAKRVELKNSMMPPGLVGNLTPQQLADLVAYLQSLK